MENTVQKLREYYLAGNTRPYRYRIEKLRLLKKSIQRHRKDLLQALAQDLGKGETESELTEIGIVLSEISLFEKRLRRFMRPVRTGQSLATMPSKNRSIRNLTAFAFWHRGTIRSAVSYAACRRQRQAMSVFFAVYQTKKPHTSSGDHSDCFTKKNVERGQRFL